jgi:hypothetical protein
MIAVRFPAQNFKIELRGGQRFIFDTMRKKWLLLTEEEWVRQNFVQFLLVEMQYPITLIALEKMIILNGLKKRFDVLVYDNMHQPWMLVECKAPQVLLSDDVLQQVLRYNMAVPVPFLVITNGNSTFGWQREHGVLKKLDVLPVFPS